MCVCVYYLYTFNIFLVFYAKRIYQNLCFSKTPKHIPMTQKCCCVAVEQCNFTCIAEKYSKGNWFVNRTEKQIKSSPVASTKSLTLK